ncbi:unnamed protein product [Meganyctiphanes norvegica]|uniref:Transposase n=1 Tax=Meganyctiphanes norvegica TaxID=48144 RepID=A0AAV2R8Z8_MEGNR
MAYGHNQINYLSLKKLCICKHSANTYLHVTKYLCYLAKNHLVKDLAKVNVSFAAIQKSLCPHKKSIIQYETISKRYLKGKQIQSAMPCNLAPKYTLAFGCNGSVTALMGHICEA